MISSKDYKDAILDRYARVKTEENSNELLDPTPSKLKRLTEILLKKTDICDKEVYRKFFLVDTEEIHFKQIQNFETDKFKPLSNFLKGKSELTNLTSLELLAILVDLQPRPYQKFRKQGGVIAEQADTETQPIKEGVKQIVSLYDNTNYKVNLEEEIVRDAANDEIEAKDEAPKDDTANDITEVKILPQKYFILGRNERMQARANFIKLLMIVLLFFVVVAFAFKAYFLDGSGCMVWRGDHYEEADCNDTQIQSFTGSYDVIPMDKETFKYMKKIKVTDTTAYYNPDGSPCVWYGKSANKEYEFFSYPGKHPETGKSLKDISNYIINKYVKNKK